MPRWPERKYDKNRHSCYLLRYHLILVTKYRHPVLTGAIREDLLKLVHNIVENKWGCPIIAVNTEMDHIHVLFSAAPQVQLSVLVNNLKTVSSREIRKHHSEELKPYYWKPYFWSDSYFIGSVGDTTEEIVSAYIEEQGREKKKYKKRR